MRKIEQAMCAAVKARRNWQSGNTRVEVTTDAEGIEVVCVYLHGNRIYEKYASGETLMSLAGWNTHTTRSRLRALGVGVHQRKCVPMYNGAVISENNWYNI